MSRISIDVTPEEHKRLKAMAALQGKSIKEFVLARTVGRYGEIGVERDLAKLEAILEKRIKDSEKKGVSTQTVESIFRQVREEASHETNA